MNLALLASALFLGTGFAHPDGFIDPQVTRIQALSFERAMEWDRALLAWQSILDRAEPADGLRYEAIAHVKDLNMKVKPANVSPALAKPWPTLVVIFRNVNATWKGQDGQSHRFESRFTDEELLAIRRAFNTFSNHVFRYTSGLIRIDPTIRIVEEPLTSLEGTGPFWLGPRIPRQTFVDLAKGARFQSIFTYTKFSQGDRRLHRAYWGGTYGGDQGPDGAAISDILEDEAGWTDGEVELHEWLHQIDWMFTAVHGYPQAACVNPDTGKRQGEEGGDPDYRRTSADLNWLGFLRHIMEDHITRRMWKEATMRDPEPTPWLKRRG